MGTIDVFEPVLTAILDSAEAGSHTSVLGPRGALLGLDAPSPAALVHLPADAPSARAVAGRALDDYIEAQVHGPVRLAEDVEALVADPSFRQGRVGDLLEELAARFDFGLSWHHGFELDAGEVPAEFRGPEVRELVRRVATDLGNGSGRINAEILGRAARGLVADPERWADHGKRAETLQHLEQLWHVLVAYGRPAERACR